MGDPRKTKRKKQLSLKRKRKNPRRKRRPRRSLLRSLWKCQRNPRRQILSILFQKEPLTLKIGRDFTPTMTRIRAANTSGPSLTPPATRSGGETTGTTRSSV